VKLTEHGKVVSLMSQRLFYETERQIFTHTVFFFSMGKIFEFGFYKYVFWGTFFIALDFPTLL
jgi:hypothetical protein